MTEDLELGLEQVPQSDHLLRILAARFLKLKQEFWRLRLDASEYMDLTARKPDWVPPKEWSK